jgi:hypothetical protein
MMQWEPGLHPALATCLGQQGEPDQQRKSTGTCAAAARHLIKRVMMGHFGTRAAARHTLLILGIPQLEREARTVGAQEPRELHHTRCCSRHARMATRRLEVSSTSRSKGRR